MLTECQASLILTSLQNLCHLWINSYMVYTAIITLITNLGKAVTQANNACVLNRSLST